MIGIMRNNAEKNSEFLPFSDYHHFEKITIVQKKITEGGIYTEHHFLPAFDLLTSSSVTI